MNLDFRFDDDLLRIDRHEPSSYQTRNGKIILGNIDSGRSKSIAVLFDPLLCSRGTDIDCFVTYRDAQGKPNSAVMESKTISVVCPILNTDSDINIGRLKEFIEKLPSRDSKVYEIHQGFDISKLAGIAREVVEKHDVRHIRTLHTKDGRNCEIWYYGKTKVHKDDIVIRISIVDETCILELFAATKSAEVLTGLLAEIGRDLKHGIEFRASGRGNVINVTIKDSVIQRSSLLDLCDMDGTCPVNLVVEDSVIQHSNIGSRRDEGEHKIKETGEQGGLRKQQEEAESLEESKRKKQEESVKARAAKYITRHPAQQNAPPKKPGSFSGKGILVFSLIFGIFLTGAAFSFFVLNDDSDDRLQEIQPVSVTASPENTGDDILKETAKTSSPQSDTVQSSQEVKSAAEPAQTSPSQSPDTYTNSIGMEFVKIPAGEFMMGSPSDEEGRRDNEGPVHKVTIEYSYYLGKFEVTQEQWREIMGSNPSHNVGDDLPVEQVTWEGAQKFLRKLNEIEGTNKYRLPSEAEWEYACRAGTTTRYSYGDDESELGDYAWSRENSDFKTHPVGQKKPNPWGLYDMHGNVWEWCQDTWHDNYSGAPSDGSAWEDGSSYYRVERSGGSGYFHAQWTRSAIRSGNPMIRGDCLGFRVLKEI